MMISDLLASPAARLLREGCRLGAKFDIDGATLVVEPETAIPESLRQKLFACEKEAVEALRDLIETRDILNTILAAMREADQFGARYALLPGRDLAVYTTKAALPPDIWATLRFWHSEIADAMETLGVVGPIGLDDISFLIAEYDARGLPN